MWTLDRLMKPSIRVLILSALTALSLAALAVSFAYRSTPMLSVGLGFLCVLFIRLLIQACASRVYGKLQTRPNLRRARLAGLAAFAIWAAWLVIATNFLQVRQYVGMLTFLGVGVLLGLAGAALVFGSDALTILGIRSSRRRSGK
jgi:hypothetical protein